VGRLLRWLTAGPDVIEAVGHRVVHGGARLTASARIDDAVLADLEALEALAPLHNRPSLAGVRACRAALGAVPMVGVFDTAFHARMPERAIYYAIPWDLARRHGIRRFGFHGISYTWATARAAALLGRAVDDTRLVVLHLGSGCSAAAIQNGVSVDTSMGFTPLEGLVMGTRSGDLDPAILPHVMRKEELNPWELSALLNKHGGLFGLSGLSNDMRALLDAERSGHARARLAIDVFCHRLKKYIAAYMGVLGGLDGLAFAGGIGENAADVRRRALQGLDGLGIALDGQANENGSGREAEISPRGARVRVFVVPTNEEILIARDTLHIVSGRPPS
jgi:acetate kinase